MSKERLLPFGSVERNEDDTITCSCFKLMHDRVLQLWLDSCNFSKKALEMGRNDPRKVIYAIKMGFALALVSLFIFWKKPADVSQFSIWAILTVIVMFEFSIGATFIKGFNRGLGTFCAGMLAFLFAELSLLAGEWEKVVIVISFFITGSFASYLKLYPTMAPYEYGYRVFVLTFCILMVAGNRTREYTVAILSRLVLIAVGACICFIINICIYPIWAGDDLHRLVVNNFKELAASLEGCVDGYLKYVDYNRIPTRFMSQASGDQLCLGYKTVIESASREQSLLGFAVWEPPHGRYRTLGHPWRTYVKVSGAVRHCAYTVMALHGCILSEIQAPPEKRQVFRSHLQRVSAEGAKVLRELGNKIEKMEKIGTDDNILKEVHEAGEQLQKKIDQRSFLLVNSESWEIGNHRKVLEDLGDLPSEREYETLQLGFKSLSETAIYVKSPLISTPCLPNKDLPKQKLRKHVPWPSWISFEGNGLIKEDEVKTYQSASALSLATFASLLIEFVARLQNVVDCFEELSEEAEFKDPNIIVLTTSASFWTRFLRCFSLKS
ncbi:aluminum-activated malate transporter 4-like isoform X2 [Sesamum indicum]|uniref:Aluminum-activated malate transporter 4-like isoform X2 n=1 Tax=Sesamum indicum TaxID=4182 RepID=A0A6I9T8A4_SESIN|nr:aluminum-activated malate transporter 4-like isoform X2 [Sesamum indicum]